MKNIFKMMGIALLACSMIMVSCKKDDDNNESGQGGQGGQGGSSSVNITFNGVAQNTPVTDATYKDISEGNGLTAGSILLFSHLAAAGTQMGDEGEEYVAPIFANYFVKVTGASAQGINISDGYYVSDQVMRDVNNEMLDANEDSWSVNNVNDATSWGNFDATAGTMTCTISLNMYNYSEYFTALYSTTVAAYPNEDLSSYQAFINFLNTLTDDEFAALAQTAMANTSTADLVTKLTNVKFTVAQ